MVILRGGSAWGQADAMEVINRDLSLHPTRDEAIRDGIARLRAGAAGEL